jgi:hypothetical protein
MIRWIEKSSDIENRTRDLPACSIVLQPTTLLVPHLEVNRVNKKGKCEWKPPVSFMYLTVTILYTLLETRKISNGPSLYTEAFITSGIQSAKPWESYAHGSWTCFSWETQAVDCRLLYYTISLILFVSYGCDCTCKWLIQVYINSLCVSVLARSLKSLFCILMYSIELRWWNIHLELLYMILMMPQHMLSHQALSFGSGCTCLAVHVSPCQHHLSSLLLAHGQ